MINIESIKKTKGFTYVFHDEPIVDKEFVKRLRTKLNLSQSMFAVLLHVKKKTIEKWEQGKNPVTNGNLVAMILLDKHPELVNDFILIEIPQENACEYEIDLEVEVQNKKACKDTYGNSQYGFEHSNRNWKLQPAR